MSASGFNMNLSEMGVRQLLRLESEITAEFKRRGLVRTNNKPLGDIAERVVLRARGGVLEPNSTKSHDVTAKGGSRIQVKAMGGRAAGTAAKFSPFRSFDFDNAAFLVFDGESFDLAEAYEIPASVIEEEIRHVPHVNGKQPTLRQVRALGLDITDEMRGAYAGLEEAS
jgi:hypothetical protein